MEGKEILRNARDARALDDEALDAVSGGAGNLDLRKPQTLSGDELKELLEGN